MELLQLIRLPLDPLHLLCQPLAELDPGWGRAGAQDTRLEIAAPIGAVAAREEGLVGALGRGECRAAARPRLAPATPNKRGVDATREGSNEGFGEGVRVGGADAPGRGRISPAAGQTAVRTALTLGSARGRGWTAGRGQALPRSDCASPRAEPPSRRRPRSPASLSPCRLPSCCHPCGGRITRLPTRARPAPRASLPPALTSSP